VRLTPRGGRDGLDGWGQDEAGRTYLKARVSAAPTEGQANAALIKLIAKRLGVAKSAVSIVSGESARLKTLEVQGMDEAQMISKLGG
jgi:hypothetical protein